MIKNPSGRMVPYNPNMRLPNNIQFPGSKPQLPVRRNFQNQFQPSRNPQINHINVPKEYSLPQPQYITAVVVQKRNIYLEEQKVPDYDAHDIFEIVSFYSSHKNGACAYTDYKPVHTDKWRVVAKYFKKIQYDVPIQDSETLECFTF